MSHPRPCSVAVVGSRTFRDYRLLCENLDGLRCEYDNAVPPVLMRLVSGGAQGADKLAERYAAENDLLIEVLKPVWRVNGVYNHRAGLERNSDIVARADLVMAFWDGVSTGTRDTITKAERRGIEVRKVMVK